MKTRKTTIARTKKKRAAKPKPTQPVSSKTFSSSFLPLMRCSRDIDDCPASGSIVAIAPGVENHACIVCGRPFRMRGRLDRRGLLLGRVPSHRRADIQAIERAKARAQRVQDRFDRAEKAARGALKRMAWNRAASAILRARAIAEQLPEQPQIQRRLHELDDRLLGAHAKAEEMRSSMPTDPRRLLRTILEASNVDLGAVRRTGWVEHASSALPKETIAHLGDRLGTDWLEHGIVEVLRQAAPQTWKDLEKRPFAGHRSVMAFLRKYPGLEGLRLPAQTRKARKGK